MEKPSFSDLSPSKLNSIFDADSWPEFLHIETPLSESEGRPSISFHIRIRPELSYFAGHFPEYAVLPGVVQVHWAATLSELCMSREAEQVPVLDSTVLLNKVKFNNPVFPAHELCLELSQRPEKQQSVFRYFDSKQTFSSGLITLAEQSTAQDRSCAKREPATKE